MPFESRVRNISPFAWVFVASTVANVVTALAVLYIAFGSPTVNTDGSRVTASIRNEIDPIRVRVVP